MHIVWVAIAPLPVTPWLRTQLEYSKYNFKEITFILHILLW